MNVGSLFSGIGIYMNRIPQEKDMVNRYTWKAVCSKTHLKNMYQENMTQLEIANELNTSQKVIWRLMRKYGIKSRIAKKRNQYGILNANWRGTTIQYAMAHKRVEKIRGKPLICEVCGIMTAKRYEWANLTRNYLDVLDYKRMCCSCHRKHDSVIKNITGVNANV